MCLDCPAGTFSAALNATVCNECDVGFYALPGASQCSRCGGGESTFQSGATSDDDCVCIPGYGFNGATEECLRCARGKYKEELGDHECTNCSANTYGETTASNNRSNCVPCKSGTFSNAGASECTSCAPGEFWNAGAGGVCEACALGKFSEDGADTVCTTCTFDNMRLNGTVFSTLQYDKQYDFVKETTCHTGSVSADLCCLTTGVPARGNEGMCCSGQTQLNPVSGNEECTNHTQPGQCIYQCAYGAYKTSEANETCQLCPEGKYKQDAGTGPCYDCEAGYGSAAGSEQCSNCDMGTYASDDGTCVNCPDNTYRGAYLAFARHVNDYDDLPTITSYVSGGFSAYYSPYRKFIFINTSLDLDPPVNDTFNFAFLVENKNVMWHFATTNSILTVYVSKWLPSTTAEILQVRSCADHSFSASNNNNNCHDFTDGVDELLNLVESADSGCSMSGDYHHFLACLKSQGNNIPVVPLPSGRYPSIRMSHFNLGTVAEILVAVEMKPSYVDFSTGEPCSNCPSGKFTTSDPPTCTSVWVG